MIVLGVVPLVGDCVTRADVLLDVQLIAALLEADSENDFWAGFAPPA